MRDYRISVLLSAYNGEKYIEKQIESVLNQDNSEAITLIIRNDGSKDSTLDILKEIQNSHSNVEIMDGPNLGLVASFFELLKHAVEREFDYYFSQKNTKKLKNSQGYRRARSGDYRIIYFIEDNKIFVIKIGLRKSVYKKKFTLKN